MSARHESTDSDEFASAESEAEVSPLIWRLNRAETFAIISYVGRNQQRKKVGIIRCTTC